MYEGLFLFLGKCIPGGLEVSVLCPQYTDIFTTFGHLKSFFHTKFAFVRKNASSGISLRGKCAFHRLFVFCMKGEERVVRLATK